MNKETLVIELLKLGIELSKEKIEQIEEFCLFLLSENKKYNLTAIRELEEVYLKHVYDSLTLIKAKDLTKEQTLLDIGSGGGFPGIILKIVFPTLKITLLDSNSKKTKFLELVKNKLKLDNLTIINARAEEYIINARECYDLVTARAVASLNVLVELAVPFLKTSGYFIAMKADILSEIELAKQSALILNFKIEEIIELKLPIQNSLRNLVVIRKLDKTPIKYPRRYEQIMKKPLIINQK